MKNIKNQIKILFQDKCKMTLRFRPQDSYKYLARISFTIATFLRPNYVKRPWIEKLPRSYIRFRPWDLKQYNENEFALLLIFKTIGFRNIMKQL
jgi:hypothetical protein